MEEENLSFTDDSSQTQTVEYVAEKYSNSGKKYRYLVIYPSNSQQASNTQVIVQAPGESAEVLSDVTDTGLKTSLYEETICHPKSNVEVRGQDLLASPKETVSYVCHMCQKSFSKASQLKHHFLTHGSQKSMSSHGSQKPISSVNRVLTSTAAANSENDDSSSYDLKPKQSHWERVKLFGKKHPCSFCSKVFCTPFALRRHLSVHTGDKPYKCEICGKAFAQGGTLRDHKINHTGDYKLFCPICNQRFKRMFRMKMHIREVHEHKKPQCKVCGKQVSQLKMSEHVQRHVVNSHLGVNRMAGLGLMGLKRELKTYKCDQCEKIFFNESSLSRHKRTHLKREERTIHNCQKCGTGFVERRYLRRHQKWHDRNPTRCFLCKSELRSAENLNMHMKRHIGNRYYCGICQGYFVSMATLVNHRNKCLESQIGEFSCTVCKGQFETEELAYRHAEQFHGKESQDLCNDTEVTSASISDANKTHKCEICKTVLQTEAGLYKHYRSHAVMVLKQSYFCKVCRKSIYSIDSEKIEEHKKTCSKTLIMCEFCDKRFGGQQSLEKHIKGFHSDKRYENGNPKGFFLQPPDQHDIKISVEKTYCCGVCEKRFSRLAFMKVHIKKHSSELVHTCNHCNTWFIDSVTLSQHSCSRGDANSNTAD